MHEPMRLNSHPFTASSIESKLNNTVVETKRLSITIYDTLIT
ncbi:hypothetical protein SAMN02982929_00799 [Saccharopolyspora kobensis]|uniref:Uncharacterized protein n=1 Tax=Saccharopolyspora kobensis TaxID=146035 RepID=A0A1H5V815_9PSEU|nr:hypothetical protein SAMN02982929_00799 [Saccharopolyspora kobensis]SFC63953.1 hypothetical protein SAMN05216506_1011271 [Saccharopolyspora kobensis]